MADISSEASGLLCNDAQVKFMYRSEGMLIMGELMKKRVRTLPAGLSVGVAALAAAVLAATPAAAAQHGLKWNVDKSMAYCKTLDNGTTLGAMKRAQCENATLTKETIIVNEAVTSAKSADQLAAEAASRGEWPGPGH
jgi:hypothetical protein